MATKFNEFTAAEMRAAMIESQLRPTDVNDPALLAAFDAVDRESFVPAHLAGVAYMDRPLALSANRYLSPPLAAARMLLQAEVQAGEKVLLIGASTGYVARLLVKLGATVVAVEEDADLAAAAPASVKIDAIQWVAAPLVEGAPDKGPYPLILVDGAIDILPDALINQLAEGGRFIAAKREGAVVRLVQGRKINGIVTLRPFADMDVPALPGFEAVQCFEF